MSAKDLLIKELATRELEKRHVDQRESLIEFIQYYFKNELKKDFDANWHYYVLEDTLKKVLAWEVTRLIINIPPRSGKTELITKCFPVWALWRDPTLEIISTGYSTSLTQEFSQQARDYYMSDTFNDVFPRRSNVREDQNTKEYWKLDSGGSYYATGTGGTITGRGANIFIIDDPIKPDDANKSDVMREWVNSWYSNTVLSRLNNPMKDSVIIIMQRTHEQDLCGMLEERMKNEVGEKFEVLSFPAIAEEDETYIINKEIYGRKKGDPLHQNRFPLEALDKIKRSIGIVNFDCQYQQNPTSKESREFHTEWFQYYNDIPIGWRVFTAVDPAFTKASYSDYSCIMTCKFIEDKIYILGYNVGKYDPSELIHEIVKEYNVWQPEKIGVESVQAQTIIASTLKNTLQKAGKYALIEEIKTRKDKETSIRGLIPHFRDGRVFIKNGITGVDTLEDELVKFPRGAHDDIPDALQMCVGMYTLQPGSRFDKEIRIEYNEQGQPLIIT